MGISSREVLLGFVFGPSSVRLCFTVGLRLVHVNLVRVRVRVRLGRGLRYDQFRLCMDEAGDRWYGIG